MGESPLRNLRHLSIPVKEEPEYRKAIEIIVNHLEIDNYSQIVRICVLDKKDWIQGDKELVDSNNLHNKTKGIAYLDRLYIDLLKEVKKSVPEQKLRLFRGHIKELRNLIDNLVEKINKLEKEDDKT